jgi:hypothetical protein
MTDYEKKSPSTLVRHEKDKQEWQKISKILKTNQLQFLGSILKFLKF